MKQKYLIIEENSYDIQDIDYVDDTETLVEMLQSKNFRGKYTWGIHDIEVYAVDEPLTVDELLKLRLGEQL